MRDVREVLRLHLEGYVPMREVARMQGIARSTVRDMVVRFERSKLAWPVPAEISDAELEGKLYGSAGVKPGRRKQPEPDWSVVARELKRKHVTLQVLWEEYIAAHPDGYRYSRWCELFRAWAGRLPLVMRQSHAGGEKMFVDYAGDTVPVVINRRTGEIRDAHLFVAVLGASSLSFACATWTEQFVDWVEAHNSAFAFFGGVAQLPSSPTRCTISRSSSRSPARSTRRPPCRAGICPRSSSICATFWKPVWATRGSGSSSRCCGCSKPCRSPSSPTR